MAASSLPPARCEEPPLQARALRFLIQRRINGLAQARQTHILQTQPLFFCRTVVFSYAVPVR
jgi:hypothetical protein